MSSKIDQLENQSDLRHELRDFFKNIGNGVRKNKEKDKELRVYENENKFTKDVNIIESNKAPQEKISIEIDLIQRTTVFSNDPSMWI
jgi:hypothetical protein